MSTKTKIDFARKTIKRFIQNDYARLWTKHSKETPDRFADDGVYFNSSRFPEITPGLHKTKKSVPTKIQTLNAFLQRVSPSSQSILDAQIFKTSNFNTNVFGNYAVVLFDLVIGLKLENAKMVTVEMIVAQTLILTHNGWRIVNEDVS
ncbi:hypothetical protein [Ulvibacterium sp.]|uniref:hypothetical protein n=1 Tax=Ulvibacterium sp. TaxID=2665914 RepID=UPI00260F201C|nr:hypothetical protein [Ulvibacterium sp.]